VSKEQQVRVHIDPDVCQGHTLCHMAAPDIFLLREEDGHSYVANPDVPAGKEDVVRKAVATCPEGAISIEE
jgi:ferredoxin